ncbi:NAD(P)/FAD-dependent oxidoreductase [Jeotgalibacillus marinus]|uniref:FAD-dependent oxidoreductase n=1 Tax=Jeotgalibacillus marinus TaxID=86667 RepID=A0ABV3Q5N0_9BACL
MNVDVSIIGAGPAGLAASIEIAKSGLSVAVIDEYFRPGGRLLGQLYDDPKAPPNEKQWDGKKVAQGLVEQAKVLGVHIFCGVTAWTVNKGWHIKLTGAKEKSLTSQVLLLATGAAERALPMPGWTLPGVFSIGAAQTFTNVHHVAVGQRVMVVGTDPLALSVVMEMKQAGIDVVGVALPPKSPISSDFSSPINSVGRLAEVADLAPNPLLRTMGRLASGKLRKLAAHALHFNLLRIEGIPVHMRKAVVSIEGKNNVEGVIMQSVTVNGDPKGSVKQVEVDAVCLSAGLYPLIDIAQVAGCPLVDIPELGGLIPVHGPNLRTPVESLFVAGNITGIEGAKVAIAQGKLAAVSIAQSLGKKTFMSEEQAIKEVTLAREQSPIRFLPHIEEGRDKMNSHWKKIQKEKGKIS